MSDKETLLVAEETVSDVPDKEEKDLQDIPSELADGHVVISEPEGTFLA